VGKVNLILRLPEELHARLVEDALAEKRSLNGYIIGLLEGRGGHPASIPSPEVVHPHEVVPVMTPVDETSHGIPESERCPKCGLMWRRVEKGFRICTNCGTKQRA